MTIQEAREAALQGKTVIGPNDVEFGREEFAADAPGDWTNEMVFGEWRVKQEPVVFETTVLPSGLEGNGILSHQNLSVLGSLIGKRVKVTVEVIE